MTKLWVIFYTIFGFWPYAGAAATVPNGTASKDLLTQLLESKICESMPHLPSCGTWNGTVQGEAETSHGEILFPNSHLMTLVLDYIATTQRVNKELRERETQQLSEIAKLEQIKEHLEGKVKSLEEEWLPVVDKYSGTITRSEDNDSSLLTPNSNKPFPYEASYQPTANLLRPVDCSDYLLVGAYKSGIYDIYPFRCRCSEPVKVWCDMETDGGGWTVILNRQKSSDPVNFTQPWREYQKGFGNVSTEYWLGNDILHLMTNTRAYAIRLDFEEKSGGSRWAEWTKFVVGNEANRYKLEVPSFNVLSRTDNCMAHHNGKYFSTFDNDHDGTSRNCAFDKKSGWWYHSCATLDPTIPFGEDGNLNTACTYRVNGKNVALQGPSLQLKIRPQICSQMVKAVHFNSHTCRAHNAN